jgi:hypothetical protein
VSVVRILISGLADSKTSLGELRERLPEPTDGDTWIANEPQERFGLISVNEDLPDLEELRALIGRDPDIAEEFDAL